MSPLLKKVEKAGIKGIKRKRKPFQINPEDFFQETTTIRNLYSKLIDNDQPNRVAIIPSVSYGIATVTQNLPFPDGEIIVANEQFPSNLYPWSLLEDRGFKIKVVSPKDSLKRAESWNNEILSAINENTRVVSVGHVHWSDGSLFQLMKIRERLDEVGGLLIVDGTQSIGALPFSVKEIRPDALIVAAYKWLLGPYSIGLGYYGEVFDGGVPLEENWINRVGSEDFSKLVNYSYEYRPEALRYEVGEHSNFILVPMLHEALKQLLNWKPENIQAYCHELTASAFDEVRDWGFQVEDPGWRAKHLVGLRIPKNLSLDDLKKSFKKNRVSVSFRGDVIRISPHVYNDQMDVRKLLNALKEPIFAQNN